MPDDSRPEPESPQQTPSKVALAGWGRFPVTAAALVTPRDNADLQRTLGAGFSGISRGRGRSYGDSALASAVVQTQSLDSLLSFDEITGILRCRSGITLGSILAVTVPRGWFLPVLPGTQFVTVGGAIASDVHGKNHHVDGSFCNHVLALRVMLASGDIIQCSEREQVELMRATCGGMGLTGIITEATLQMRRISSSYINQRSLKAGNLRECFDQIEAEHSATYSVAWLDCMARGERLGRSVLFVGEHGYAGGLEAGRQRALEVPFTMPAGLLNRHSMSLFNQLYFHAPWRSAHLKRIHFRDYFFPLDGLNNWNRLYGKGGFLQYQFVIPTAAAYEGIQAVLQRVTASGKGSFLSVLKKFGPANANLLSFPVEGYTLTLDFKFENDLLPLLAELDAIVLGHGGRLYLAKDARMSEDVFKRSYPQWEAFAAVRERFGATGTFNSLQSARLGL